MGRLSKFLGSGTAKMLAAFAILALIVLAVNMNRPDKEGRIVISKNITRDDAERLALETVYKYTKNKDVFDKPLEPENYVYDSWLENSKWRVILYVSHTTIEAWVDTEGNVQVLQKTDYKFDPARMMQ